MPSLWSFKKYGQCGMDVSELFPHVAKKVDDIALIRSMYAISNDHGPALFQMNTGFIQAGYPSMGSWVTYGLGTENQNLPGFRCLLRLARRPDRRRAKLGQRFHARGVSGNAVPLQRRSDCRLEAAERYHARAATSVAGFAAQAE